ncbi:MAG TPA: TPM domain-containing protein [Gemmatimonas sp.]|nr:TPM domain-containing protein [Gemmatimonas sp.]
MITRWSAAVRRHGLMPLLVFLVLIASVPHVAHAQIPVGPDAALPSPVGYVNDFANVLPAEARARLEGLAQRVNAATRGDMVVVTLPDLGGRPIEEVSLRLGREWKLGADAAVGDAARNAGVVILIVPKETASDGRGRCRIETGQGAEGFIVDATAAAICRSVTEQFAARNYAGAIEQIAMTVADRYAAEFGVNLDGSQRPQERRRERVQPNGGIPFWLIILLFIVLPVILSRGRGRGRGGCVGCIPIPIGGFGGGGFGGGGFSGGGFGGGGGGGFGGFGGGGGFSGGGGGSDW